MKFAEKSQKIDRNPLIQPIREHAYIGDKYT